MLDKDLATLYGVETRTLNQAVKRNIQRFPSDFRFHYGSGNARGWTEGCFVLSSDYTISGGKVQYNLNESKKASQNFDKILGASSHYDYKIPARNGTTKTRNGSRFDTSISHKLILKSRTK